MNVREPDVGHPLNEASAGNAVTFSQAGDRIRNLPPWTPEFQSPSHIQDLEDLLNTIDIVLNVGREVGEEGGSNSGRSGGIPSTRIHRADQ